jgi:hypothetical protein
MNAAMVSPFARRWSLVAVSNVPTFRTQPGVTVKSIHRALITAIVAGAFAWAFGATPALAGGPTRSDAKRPAAAAKAKATAASKRATRARAANTTAPTKRTKNYDFMGDTLIGDMIRPEGEDIHGRPDVTHANLIRYRTQFHRELTRTAERL